MNEANNALKQIDLGSGTWIITYWCPREMWEWPNIQRRIYYTLWVLGPFSICKWKKSRETR